MATASSPSPSTPAPSSGSPSEESRTKDLEAKQREVGKETKEEEVMYKTKTIQFLGRTTPIILQNENGPCPLLAICNVLLLRNNLNLNPDCSEVSQERLLSLVAERLIDSNSNINNKDKEYIDNQQQNISDAIDLLEHLATGIDVNIKFTRINDFEFTPECAIFDLLDIPLYHGWIVDPQDVETADAIGCKSYNALMSELVALEPQNGAAHSDLMPAEDSVDFVAATTAALGVPSPCLSKTRSFDDSPPAAEEHRKLRKGDLEEEAELLRALQLSEKEGPASIHDAHADSSNGVSVSSYSDENQISEEDLLNSQHTVDGHASPDYGNINQLGQSKSDDKNALDNCGNKTDVGEEICPMTLATKSSADPDHDQLSSQKSEDGPHGDGGTEKSSESTSVDIATSETLSVEKTNLEPTITANNTGILPKSEDGSSINPALDFSHISQHDDGPNAFTSGEATGEPIYEGEECVNSVAAVCEDKEPVYEGESLLGRKAEKSAADPCSEGRAVDGLTPAEGNLIRSFLESSASQLTFCGLFCLQEGLKERELCVFFRNNHFSTMFKYEGELYLLATDQGYMNQPDLVWEKLNEVNGDTVFMTGNFRVFKMDNGSSGTWNEQNVVSNTADYLASINTASEAGHDINSDLQLAIALQQQEFEQQSPRSNTTPPAQPVGTGPSGLITGPQVPRSSHRPSAKPEGKPSKDSKCTVM
ncbi:PREDICTED: ubiquitin carboxyl-terminal hydrolase MINDY-1-like [Tarenaya hassleriana]|uniref:ubiquitin carboxyl-terminal hydrolase MINDY-1-like n=1 Tax=Tarenaya hassleriana TaxID=28532 RepID=UPI00053C2DBB|nr:PREDICTED: ubiquitin carboxyl-terminal hydrolase MINDY-1-like [Tarenaya hassleriana]